MAIQIDSLEVEVRSSAGSAAKEINQMADALKNLKPSANKAGKEVSKFSNTSKGLSKSGGLFKSVGRIAFYRAIRSALKAVTNAVKEGTSNLYQYGKSFNSSFVQSMDAAATSVQYLKNGLAVGLGGAIQALTPAIISMSDALAGFGNQVSEMYAWKNGDKTFTKATKSAKEYAEAVDKAKRATLGFDELNVIEKQDSVADMFTTENVNAERAAQTETLLSSLLAGTVGLAATTKLGQLFPSVLGFTKGEGGKLEYNLGDVALKAGGMSLMVAGGVTGIEAIIEGMNKGFADDATMKKLGMSAILEGAGLALYTKNPIPIFIAAEVFLATTYMGKLDRDLYNATHNPQTGEAYYDESDYAGAMNSLEWELAGKPGDTYSKYISEYVKAKKEGRPINFDITDEEYQQALDDLNWDLISYYNDVRAGKRKRDYEMEAYMKNWTSPRNQFLEENADKLSGVGAPSAGNVVDLGLIDSFSDIYENVKNYEHAQNGDAYGANGSAGGLKIELYVDGKQIIGAARIAERTMGKQMVSNGIILE